jgi:tetratricopeptide (TPR) repeat protein
MNRLRSPLPADTRFSSVGKMLVIRRALQIGLVLLLLVGLWGYQTWSDPDRRFARGREALRSGDEQRLEAAIESLQDYDQYTAHRAYLRGGLLLRQNKPQEALEELAYCLDHPHLERDALVLSGQACYVLGLPGNAKQYWERALQLDPHTVDAHRWLGVLYYDLGAMENAIRHLQEVSKLDKQDPRADRLIGLINSDYERPNFAINHYRESLRRDPDQADAEQIRLELAKCEVKQREFDAALKTLAQCEPSPRQKTILAECYWNLGEHDKARKLIQEARQAEPENLDTLLQHAQMQLAEGKIADAAATYQQAVDAHPYNYHARHQLAQTLHRLERDEEAESHEKRAEELQQKWAMFSDLQVDAINQPANALIRYEIGMLARQLGKPELARTWFQAALAIDPALAPALKALDELE